MPLNRDARLLISAAKLAQLPPIETLTPIEAREHFDARTDNVAMRPNVGEVINRSVPGPDGDIPIRVYRPADAPPDTPVLMFFHGGGWVIGTLETHDVVCRALTEATAATVVSVGYRLAPEHPYPAAIDDCEAATRWVAENGESLGVNSARMAVCGDSAGANLASAVALSCVGEGPIIAAQALVYPVSDLSTSERDSMNRNAVGYLLEKSGMRWFIDHYAPEPEKRTEFRCSPIHGDLVGQPPALVLTAEYDPLLDDGRDFADALAAAGVDVDYEMAEGHVHTFFTQVGIVEASTYAVNRIADFLNDRW